MNQSATPAVHGNDLQIAKSVYLVRHGQLDRDAFRREQRTAGLTPAGREQAKLTARRLASLDVRAIYSSTIRRAQETTEIIAGEFRNIPVRSTDLLRELPNVGGADDDSWRTLFAAGKRRGERAFTTFTRPAQDHGCVTILVSHGNLIRYVACRVLGIPPESWLTLGISHCGVTHLYFPSPGWIQVVCYNDTGHLPDHLHC